MKPNLLKIKEMERHALAASGLLKQLANSNRLMILCRLVQGEETVGGLVEHVGLAQSAVSQHLSRLKDAGLVTAEKRGQQVYYALAGDEAKAVLAVLYKIYCGGELR